MFNFLMKADDYSFRVRMPITANKGEMISHIEATLKCELDCDKTDYIINHTRDSDLIVGVFINKGFDRFIAWEEINQKRGYEKKQTIIIVREFDTTNDRYWKEINDTLTATA